MYVIEQHAAGRAAGRTGRDAAAATASAAAAAAAAVCCSIKYIII